MKVTPLDIRRKEFKRSMRGYSDEEVDVFLDEVADEFERLFQENMELHDRMQRLEEQIAGHVQIKDALEKTLISAQLQADEMRANARKEGELILRDAELKARHIVNDSYGETQRVQQALIQLKHLEEDFRFKFRSLLEGHLNLLNEAPITVRDPEAAVLAPEPVSDAEALPLAEALADAEEPLPAEAPPAVPIWPSADSELADLPTVEAPEPVAAAEELDAEPPMAAAASAGETSPAPEDDVPTEETEFGAAEFGAAQLVAELAGPAVEAPEEAVDASAGRIETESVDATQEAVEEEPPPRGFFFGRDLDGEVDDFLSPETVKKEKGRDFEW